MSNPEISLSSVVLTMTPASRVTVSATAGHQAHGAFLAMVREVDPELSAALHDPEGVLRPFTISPLLGVGRAQDGRVLLSPGEEYALRVTCLRPQVHARLVERFLRPDLRQALRLGKAELLVKEVRVTPGSHPWAGYTSWGALVAAAADEEEIGVEFTSPTAFSFGQQPWGKKIVPLPLPALVFGSLARAWNAFAPPELQLDRQALATYLEEHVVIKRLADLRTQMLDFGKAPQLGFVGAVSYGLMAADGPIRSQLNALAAFAFYAGVGMKTTMGMGQCRPWRR
jgi:CRISPR-associated endoribonuclease Cas6